MSLEPYYCTYCQHSVTTVFQQLHREYHRNALLLFSIDFVESGTLFLLQTQEGRFPALYLCCRGSSPLWPFDSHLKLYSLLPKKRKEKSRQSSRDTISAINLYTFICLTLFCVVCVEQYSSSEQSYATIL